MERDSSPARSPANTEHEARQRYTRYLQKSLSCLSPLVWQWGPAVRGDAEESALFLPNGEPLRLKTESGGTVRLQATQRFVVIPDEDYPGEFKTSTREYVYQVWDSDDSNPLVEWHWHPRTTPEQREPHVHARPRGADFAWATAFDKLHIPTERVAFELVAQFLINDLRVEPARPDWAALLDEALRAFRRFRRWPRSEGLKVAETASEKPATQSRPKRTRATRRKNRR